MIGAEQESNLPHTGLELFIHNTYVNQLKTKLDSQKGRQSSSLSLIRNLIDFPTLNLSSNDQSSSEGAVGGSSSLAP